MLHRLRKSYSTFLCTSINTKTKRAKVTKNKKFDVWWIKIWEKWLKKHERERVVLLLPVSCFFFLFPSFFSWSFTWIPFSLLLILWLWQRRYFLMTIRGRVQKSLRSGATDREWKGEKKERYEWEEKEKVVWEEPLINPLLRSICLFSSLISFIFFISFFFFFLLPHSIFFTSCLSSHVRT